MGTMLAATAVATAVAQRGNGRRARAGAVGGRPDNRAMPLTALVLVLVAALLHATWNIAAKKAGGGDAFMLMTALMAGVIWAPLALALGWQELTGWRWREWGFALASAVVHVFYFRALLRGYREADLTVVYPVARGSGPLVTVLAAIVLLGEPPTWQGALGALGVCAGVFVLAGGPRLWRVSQDPAQRRRLHTGLRWGAITGACIACYSVLDGYAVKVVAMSPILLDWLSQLLRVPFLLPGQWRAREAFAAAWRAQWRHALVGAVLSPMAYVMVLYAVTMAPLSHVAPAREVSMLFAALLGGRLLGEGDRALRLAGAALIAAGVVALATGG
jgi:drug/metabolite transporter (DMT)-like permease